MEVFDSMETAVDAAHEEDYIAAVKWEGRDLLFITTPEPHRLQYFRSCRLLSEIGPSLSSPAPQIVIMRRPAPEVQP